jgi:hypothetical protein
MDAQSWITLLAVIVALFGGIFWDWWKKPKIRFSLSNHEPHIIIKYPELIKYFRIKAENKGKTTARNCCIKLISVKTLNNNRNLIEPDKLKWASAPKDTRYTNEAQSPIHKEYKDIHPEGGWEFCDIFRLDSTKLVELKFMSSGNRTAEIRDEYLITIEISGDNFKPKRATIRTHNPKNNYWDISWNWN